MNIALAQMNPVIADVAGNRDKMLSFIERARDAGADLVVFPEMSVLGYPPMDLLEQPKLINDNMNAMKHIAAQSNDIAVVAGFVHRDGKGRLHNAAAFCNEGKMAAVQYKTLLPSYDVFDETRYFTPARDTRPVDFMGQKVGITICEDIWNPSLANAGEFMEGQHYTENPVHDLSVAGIDLLINISASPYVMGKNQARRRMLTLTAGMCGAPVVYVNQVGGNDSLVFDGNSVVVDEQGGILGAASGFQEDLVLVDTHGEPKSEAGHEVQDIEEVRQALVLGLADYSRKCGFKQLLLGLSGGIDSALTAVIACQAVGPENVLGITMPSQYSSTGSVDDSRSLAKNLGMDFEIIPIKGLYDQYVCDLEPLFRGMKEDITEENIQARIRGNLLMAVSNKTGRLLLTTGNKSELAMGYCTLYGDMAGGLAVISDLPKTEVYRLARHINGEGEVIPWNTIEKPPSAELRPDQKDQDSLPPYEVLDDILEKYIEERQSAQQIVEQGHDPEIVNHVLRVVNINEYKRRQAPPGLKVTTKAFGTGRRIPLAMKFRP